MAPEARRALASSATTRDADSTGEAGVREQLGRIGGGTVAGGVPEGWEDARELEEDGGAFGFSNFSDDAEGDDFLGTEEADNAPGDADESDAEQQSTTTATETEGGVDEMLQSQIKDPSMMRLSRRIARSGMASRREAERLVEAGVVTVNGTPVQTPALNVGPRDIVKVKVGLVFRSTARWGTERTSIRQSSIFGRV